MLRQAIRTVFSPLYQALALGVALIVFLITTWLPNITLLTQIATSSSATFSEKMGIFFTLAMSIGTNFTWFSIAVVILTALLFGINVAMIAYFMRKQRSISGQGKTVAGATGGLFSGFLGIGCAACGTLVLAPLLSLIGGAALLASLPFSGQEFGLLGIALIGYSIYSISKKIVEPAFCKLQ